MKIKDSSIDLDPWLNKVYRLSINKRSALANKWKKTANIKYTPSLQQLADALKNGEIKIK